MPRAENKLEICAAAKIPEKMPEIRIRDVDTMARPPMPEEARLDVGKCQRLLQKKIRLQKKLRYGQIIGRSDAPTETFDFFP